ncbi:unnamed protein product, partial [Symbiodinium sp. CCMP2456]
ANLYLYLQKLKTEKCTSTASVLLEAMRFAHGMFGFLKVTIAELDSPRVKGAAHSMFVQKKVRSQAPAIPVEVVKKLVGHAGDPAEEPHVSMIAGQLLKCIFGVGRWSDFRSAGGLEIDEFEGTVMWTMWTTDHKTAQTKEAKTRLLPFLGLGYWPGFGNWISTVIDNQTAAGLDQGLRSWNHHSSMWNPWLMSSSEATAWLRETMLGHHVEAATKSATTYDHNTMLALQAKVLKMIEMIAVGSYRPDDPPAARLKAMAGSSKDNLEGQVESAEEKRMQEANQSSSSDDDEEAEPKEVIEVQREPLPADAGNYSWFRHRVSSIVHIASDSSGHRLRTHDRAKTSAKSGIGRSPILATWRLIVRPPSDPANAGIDDAALMNHVNGLLTHALTPTAVAGLRRLAFEAQALALQDLKTKLESPAEHEPKVLPLQEKMARLTRQKERLVGVVLTPHNTPSHALIDKACSQLEEGSLQWIHPNKCTSRHSEALSEKPQTSLSFDSKGSIKVSKASHDLECDTSSAHLLRVALQRRALAYDVANLFSFSVLERWHQSLFDRLHHVPPPGYLATSLHQLVAADKALWLLVAEDTRAKLTEMDPDQPALRLCESHMNYYADHPDVLFHLMPLKAGGAASGGKQPQSDQPGRSRNARRQNRSQGSKMTQQAQVKRPDNPGYSPIVVPEGCTIMFNGGKPICKKFNVGRCKVKTAKGGRCSNGFHVCWKEEFASALIADGDLSYDSLRRLFSLLPLEPPARGVGVGMSGSFTTGAYSFGGEVGLRRNLSSFPITSSLLAKHVQAISPSFSFTSVALFRNLKTPCHRDANNFPDSYNLVAPVAHFEEGAIWCEDDGGDHLLHCDGVQCRGRLLDVARGPVLLPAASSRHCTLDWTGDRLVLVAFSIREALDLPVKLRDRLRQLHFTLPDSVGDLTQPPPLTRGQTQVARRPLMVEICSGSGSLSAAFRDRGFPTMAIDRPGNDHRLCHSFVPLDLTLPRNQDLLMGALNDAVLVGHVHLGVPCGTCSRARDKALPKKVRGKFAAPQPLRDAAHPLGKPGLAGPSKDRVRAANELYRFAIRVVLWAFQRGVPVTIENPSRSWLWPALECLVKRMTAEYGPDLRRAWKSLRYFDLDACMFGGKRKKRTRLASSFDLSSMARSCDGRHEHLPWSITEVNNKLSFATAEEAQYPSLFCQTFANLFVAHWERSGVLLPPPGNFCSLSGSRASPPLIPQFREIVEAPVAPRGEQYKILASEQGGGLQGNKTPENSGCKVGIRWTPQEFLQQAKQVKHPMNPDQALSETVKDALFHNLTLHPVEVAKSRIQAVITIKQMAEELEDREREFKDKLDPIVSAILKPKRLLLWKSLLSAAEYDDMAIVDLVASGIPLTGSHGAVPALPEKLVPATDSHASLLASAPLRRIAITSRNKETSEKEQADLTEAADAEVKRGEIEGPFSEDQITEHFGSSEWLLNPRFALYQGAKLKLRVIDDARRSGLNEAYQRTCAATLMDLDSLSCVIAALAKAIVEGTFQGSEVHEVVRLEQWMGRTLDLSRAYKQLAIDPSSRRVCVLGFQKGPSWIYYRCNVLPFGARASVFSFLRVSRSLHFIMAKYLKALNTVFFDDYPMVATGSGSQILLKSASSVLNLLGWAHAEEGEKAPGFQQEFVALGVQISLNNLGQGRFTVSNKPGRVEKLVAMIQEAATNPDVAKSLPELHGHLNFASGFFYNKGLKFVSKALNKASSDPASEVFQGLCRVAVSLLRATPPRSFDLSISGPPLLVFTDGAWESGRAGAGAVVHCCATGATFACEIPVPQELVRSWLRDAGEQIICQIEMWAFLALRVAMCERFHAMPVLAWIDNEAARYALMKGTADSVSLRNMARLSQHAELTSPALIWFERVASFSNPADLPSRGGLVQACVEYGAEPFELPDVSELVRQLLRLSDQPWAEI